MEQVIEQVTSLLVEWGYIIVFLLSAADNLGLPAAGDVVLLAAAALSATGNDLEWGLVVTVAFLGGLTSDSISYCIGRFGGGPIARRLLPDHIVAKVETRFHAHSRTTIISARMLAGLRAGVPVLAGTSRFPYRRFLVYNIIACAIWASVVGSIGYFFARSLPRAAEFIKQGSLGLALLAAAIVVLAAAIAYARHRRRHPRPPQQDA